MRHIILVFLFLVRPLFASDIVLIDTGYSKNTFSNITIGPPAFTPIHHHGQEMLTSLNNELFIKKTQASTEMVSCEYRLPEKSCIVPLTYPIIKAVLLSPKIISISISGDIPDNTELIAIKLAQSLGILVIAASGNGGRGDTAYPAKYGGECMLSVGTIINSKIASYSKDAEVYIEQVGNERGTSYSTARVAGRAWAYWSKHPELTCKEVKRFLLGK